MVHVIESMPKTVQGMKKRRINLARFLDFIKGLKLISSLNLLKVSVCHYKNSRMVYLYVLLMAVFGKSSFLQMDHSGRFSKLKRIFRVGRFANGRYRHCVVSDSTIIRRLSEMTAQEVYQISYTVLRQALREGLVYPIAIVDGTQIGGCLYSCLCFITRYGDVLMVDKAPIDKRGKELIASEILVKRCCRIIGKGVIKLLLADMLYFNERFWGLVSEGAIGNLLVKYTPDPKYPLKPYYRKILRRFAGMKSLYEKPLKTQKEKNQLKRMLFTYHKKEDECGTLSYEIFRMGNNSWDNRWQVAQVYEADHDGCFYVFTTDKKMHPTKMREHGHRRWYIENDGFKMLNAHLGSKRIWSHNQTVLDNLISILMLGYSLLCLFGKVYQELIGKQYNQAKLTIKFTAQILMMEAYGKVCLQGI